MIDKEPTARDLLAFEQLFWRRPGAKEAAIAERFGITSTVYYARLLRACEQPGPDLAVEFASTIAATLRQLRARRWQRTARRAG